MNMYELFITYAYKLLSNLSLNFLKIYILKMQNWPMPNSKLQIIYLYL